MSFFLAGAERASGQGRSSTVPFGYLKKTLRGTNNNGGLELLGAPFANPVEYQGKLSGAGVGSIVGDGAEWEVSQFRPNPEVATHFVEIVLAADLGVVGSWSNIVGNTEETLQIESDWSEIVEGGEFYVIRRHRTIGDVFGETNEIGIGAGNVTTADSFAVLDAETKEYTSYYYKNGGLGGVGWRTTSNPFTTKRDQPLLPHQGFYFRRRQAEDANVVFAGFLKLGRSKIPLKEGVNLVNLQTPVTNQRDLSLQGYSLTLGALEDVVTVESGLELVFQAGQASTADSLSTFDPVRSAYTSFYRKSGGLGGSGWRTTANPFIDQAGTGLPGGAAFFIRMKSGDGLWTRPQTFVLKK